uniref:TMF_TATA_bd domain-containing protein n=1 Tax=Hydatigena taeniaeformis TaxID=6205 RepID=A0A0R3WRJ9_HYDTA
LQKAYDELLSVREEMASCVERETQLSEFTRRLTERNAGLQTAHLATQARLEASERAVSEASRAAKEATDLLHAFEQRARMERTQATNTITSLEAKISELRQSEEALRVDLTREQVENASLKRKQHALDRELARLMAQQRKLSYQASTNGTPCQDITPNRSLADSNLSISALNDVNSLTPQSSKLSSPLPALGDALLVASRNEEVAANSVASAAREAATDNIGASDLEVQTLEPNRLLLLNKIDRLQRTNVRLMEKIDFMHEHIGQLTQELQKKSQILQDSTRLNS